MDWAHEKYAYKRWIKKQNGTVCAKRDQKRRKTVDNNDKNRAAKRNNLEKCVTMTKTI